MMQRSLLSHPGPAAANPVCIRALACALTALLLCAAPGHAQPEGRIWGRITLNDGERLEGFLRFHGEQNAASWGDVFESLQDVGEEPRQTWIRDTRGARRFLRTVELRGYRVSWNDRSDDFPDQRTIHLSFGSIQAVIVHDHNLEVALRSGTADAVDATGRAGASIWSGGPDRLVGETDEDWPETRIDVDNPLSGVTSIVAEDVDRIEFASAPTGEEASSARLLGRVEDDSGRVFSGLVTWDNRAVLLSDTLGRRLSGSSLPPIRFEEIRSIERDSDGARATLLSGEMVELTGGRQPRGGSVSVGIAPIVRVQVEGAGRRRDPAGEIMVIDPELGTITIDWDDFSALHLDPGATTGVGADNPAEEVPDAGRAPAAAGPDHFDGGTPLRAVVLTHDGEEIEGRIRWNALKEWSWDRLYVNSDGAEIATEFGNIRSIEQLAFPDMPPNLRQVPGSSLRGRARVTLVDGRTYEATGYNDLGSGNLGLLVRTAATADGVWRFVAWDDVKEVRFVHAAARSPNR